ncbi:uncharacterized protein LOC113283648 [Papaver somniferum]|uniref:uncharacterized protein LOC113283648 n=1 Tax=Papaver somniferum TaxID=3469 RepID=UPI000E70502A|nr:uncharacterized protein LOC113283648 [Papaver somniferum]XP_026388766.1 uncharacterized protein LOC113283648 [Papaver somniferum]
MDTFATRSNRVLHSTCSGGDEDSEEKEAIRMEKELIRLDKEEIRLEKESIRLERDSIRLEREAISLEKEAIRLEKEAIRSEKEAIRSEKEAVQQGLYEVEDVRRKRVSKGQTQYLIKWLGWPESHNTWEPIENLQECLDIVAAFEERLCSRGRKRKRKGTFSQPMKTETIDEEGKGNETIDNLFSKSGAKWMTYENDRMFENENTSVLDLDDAQNGDGEGPTRDVAAGDQHEEEMFSNPCSNGVQDVCVESAAISEPNLVLDKEVLEEQSNASVCEANIATSVVLDSEVKGCSQDDRNFTVEVGSQPHPSERTEDHWKPCPTDLPCASKSAQGSPPRKTSCQQGSPSTEEVTQVNSKMSSHTSHESPRKSADDTTTAGLEVPNDKASPLKNELLLCKEECQDSEGGTDQGTDQFISIPDAPGKDDLLKSFTKTLEKVTPKKQIKRSWDSTLSTLSPRSLGVVKCVVPAEEIRPLGSIEGSNTEPSLVPTVQPSSLPDLNISIPTLTSFQHPPTDSR